MEQNKTLKYNAWRLAGEEEQQQIRKAFRFKGNGMLAAYIVLLVLIVVSILCNLLFQQINIWFVGCFSLIALATVAGIGNQVKLVRELRDRSFEVRDAIVKKLYYTNKRKYQVSSYELEVNEHNVIKTMIVTKGYRCFRPKEGDRVLLARPQKTANIYFYQLLERE